MSHEFVVFNNIQNWEVPLVSHKGYLKPPHLSFDLRFPLYPDIAADKARSERIGKVFAHQFDSKFTSTSNQEFARLQKSIDEIEAELEQKKKKPQSPLEKEDIKARLTRFNDDLNAAVARWKDKVQCLAAKCFQEAVETLDKENKSQLQRAKVWPVLKIILIAGLSLTAAGLAIAFSGGSATIIVAAAISMLLTVYKTYRKLSEEVRTEAKMLEATKRSVEADLKVLEKKLAAIAADQIDQKSAPWKELGAGMVPLSKHLAELQKHRVALHIKSRKAIELLHAAEKKFPDLKADQEAAKAAAQCSALIKRAEVLDAELTKVMDLEAKAAKLQSEYKALVRPSIESLAGPLRAVATVGTEIAQVLGGASSLLGEFQTS